MTGIRAGDKREQMEKGSGGEEVIGGGKAEEREVKVGSTGAFGRLNLSKVWFAASAPDKMKG